MFRTIVRFLIVFLAFFHASRAVAQDTTALMKKVAEASKPQDKLLATQALARYFDNHKQNAKALEWAEKGIAFTKDVSNDSLVFSQYDLVSELASFGGDNDKALEVLQTYIKQRAGSKANKELGMAYNNIGKIQGVLGDYLEQTNYYIKAQKIYNSLNLNAESLTTEANLANVLIVQGDYANGISSLRKVVAAFEKRDNYGELSGIYGNMTTAFMKLKQADSALLCSKKQLDAAQKSGDKNLQFNAWQKRGAVGSILGNIEVLKTANDSMLHYADLLQDLDKQALAYSNIGLYYATALGNFKEAKGYFEKALALNRQSGDKTFLINSLNNLGTACNLLGENERAFKLMEEAYQLKDQTISEAGQEKILNLQTRYQTEKKDARIQLLDAENKVQQRNILVLIIGILALALLALLLFKLSKTRQKHNHELSKVNQELREANQTKAKLFGILSHDLRSPISQVYQFLKLQQMEGVTLDEEKRSRLNDKVQSATGSLLETMEELLLWSKTQMNHFEPKIASVNVFDVIQECLKLLQLNIDAKNINIKNSVSENQTTKTDEYFLQTILRNLLQNAVKAAPENTSISIDWNDNTLVIQNQGEAFTQKDYEQALKKELDKNSLSGLGLKLAEELSGKISAQISFGENQHAETTITYLKLRA